MTRAAVARRTAVVLLLAVTGLSPLATTGRAVAQEEKPKPEIKGASLLGVLPGRSATVTLFGEKLAPKTVTFPKGPLTAKLAGEVQPTEGDDKKRGAQKVAVEVAVPADCPPDVYEMVLLHEGDVKAAAPLAVFAPAAAEAEVKRPCATFAEAMPVAPDPSLAITGALAGDTADRFRFAARRGEIWEITVLAGRAGSALDPILRLRDARHVSVALAAGNDKKDRRITFPAPADGVYYVELSDAEGRNGPHLMYRMILTRKSL
jgi:hypothetical protein